MTLKLGIEKINQTQKAFHINYAYLMNKKIGVFVGFQNY